MFDVRKALAMGLFIAAILTMTSGASAQLPPPAEEKKGGLPAPLTPTTTDVKLSSSMEKLKTYLDKNSLKTHYTLNEFAFSVVLPTDKIDASWQARTTAEAAKAFPADKEAATVKTIVGVCFVSSSGATFDRAVFRYKDGKDATRTVNVRFGLAVDAADQLALEFIQSSEAEVVLKRFESLVKK